MARGGARPGAGRPRKSENPQKAKQIQVVAAVLPAAAPASEQFKDAETFLMSVVNDKEAAPRDRITSAMALLPYQKPRMGEASSGKKDQQKEAAHARAAGKFAPPSAPGKSAPLN